MWAQKLSCFVMQLRALFLLALRPPFSLPLFKLLLHQPSKIFLVQWPPTDSQLHLRHPNLVLSLAKIINPTTVLMLRQHPGLLPLTLPHLERFKLEVLRRRASGPGQDLGGWQLKIHQHHELGQLLAIFLQHFHTEKFFNRLHRGFALSHCLCCYPYLSTFKLRLR